MSPKRAHERQETEGKQARSCEQKPVDEGASRPTNITVTSIRKKDHLSLHGKSPNERKDQNMLGGNDDLLIRVSVLFCKDDMSFFIL
jgi:hypothetical protein